MCKSACTVERLAFGLRAIYVTYSIFDQDTPILSMFLVLSRNYFHSGSSLSEASHRVRKQTLIEVSLFSVRDFIIVPRFPLYPETYWVRVSYRSTRARVLLTCHPTLMTG